MHFLKSLSVLLLATTASSQETFPRSSKRGLVFTPSSAFLQDDQVWKQPGSDLTWYYNHMWQPSPQFSTSLDHNSSSSP